MESLDLSINSLISDEWIKNLTNLKKLQLVNNEKITDNGIKNLINLEILNLQWNK